MDRTSKTFGCNACILITSYHTICLLGRIHGISLYIWDIWESVTIYLAISVHVAFELQACPDMRAVKPYVCRSGLGMIHRNDLPKEAALELDSNAYASLLQQCTNITALKQVHARILINGFDQDIFLGTKLVRMYALCGSMENARLYFDKMIVRDLLAWNEIIKGYACKGPCEEALALYYQMQGAGLQPNNFTYPFVLKACAALSALQDGKEIHGQVLRTGFGSDAFVGNALVDMYAKCGSIEVARKSFDNMSQRDVVSWNAMIAGYAQNGHADMALTLFNQMQLAGVQPNLITVKSVLPACAHLAALRQGEWIHDYVIRSGFQSDVIVETALVDMYGKCGKIETARQLFDKMPERNVFSWSAMIAAYAQSGHASEALTLLHQMQRENVVPDSVVMLSVLPACAHLAALEKGKWIHGYVIKRGFVSDITVGNALIDMYAKCGTVEIARQLFDKMARRDVVSWNAIIAGYGMHGHGKDALALFSQMQLTGTEPDDVTFTCVLSACSHAGLVHEGRQYFDSMSQDYCITPRVQHYTCMVDLIGRAGHLGEAQDFIKRMPIEANAGVWGALLGACRIHCNVGLGECVAGHIFNLEPENPGYYVLLSNIYAAAGRWDGVEKVRAMMKDRGLKKPPGWSFIEVNKRIHTLFVGSRLHPQSEKIYAMLETLAGQMKEEGYMPDTNVVLHNLEEEEKEHMLGIHSEKLAIAFGLINTSPGTPIRITKNLRVCGDCHSATKFISKIVRREIFVRDANRFHHFKDGLCSCRDYW